MAELTITRWQPDAGVDPGEKTYIDPAEAGPWVDEYLSGEMKLVKHGTVADTARPTLAGAVWWMGSVQPTNMAAQDYWSDTAQNKLFQMNAGGALVQMAGAGLSAYELAVQQGFTGTLQEWLDSLVVWADGTPAAATPTVPGVVRLAGDLQGTADAPVIGLPSPGTTNDLAQINAYLAGAGKRWLIGEFTVNGTIVVPEGVQVDASRAVITQTASNTTLVSLAAGCTWTGGRLIGKTTDYTPAQGSFTVNKIGIKCEGDSIIVDSPYLEGFGNAGIYANNAPGIIIRNPTIRGVDGLPGATTGSRITIASQDAACFGIYFLANCPDATVENAIITDVSIGLIMSFDTARFTMTNVKFLRVKGQHGAYLQNGNGLRVSHVFGDDVVDDVVKLQIADRANVGVDQYGGTLTDIQGQNCDTVLVIAPVQADLSNSPKLYGFTIENVQGVNCNQVAYFKGFRGGLISHILGQNVTSHGLQMYDMQDIELDGVLINNVGQNGILMGTTTGAKSSGIAMRSIRIHNYGTAGLAQKYGMVIIGADDYDYAYTTIDGVNIRSDTGAGQYGFWFQKGQQETLRVRHLVSQGAGEAGARVASATRRLGEWADVDTGPTTLWPSAYPVRVGTLGASIAEYACNRQPTQGVFYKGDRVHNSAGAPGTTMGWVQVNSLGGASEAAWAANTAYTIGQWILLPTGQVVECTSTGAQGAAGGTSGATAPTAPGNGLTVVDGTVTWTQRAATVATWRTMPNIAA